MVFGEKVSILSSQSLYRLPAEWGASAEASAVVQAMVVAVGRLRKDLVLGIF